MAAIDTEINRLWQQADRLATDAQELVRVQRERDEFRATAARLRYELAKVEAENDRLRRWWRLALEAVAVGAMLWFSLSVILR